MGATERILQYIDYKKISKYKFCKDLGFSNKFLDNSSNMGTDKACIIIHHFTDLNPEWLLTGNGSMLKSQENVTTVIKEDAGILAMLSRENAMLKENNDLLRFKVETLATENARLQSIINAGTESKRQAG